jgi:predicted alpha/beta-fold hydrolase
MLHLHNLSQSREDLLEQLSHDLHNRWIGLPAEYSAGNSDPKLLIYPALTKLFTDVDGITASTLPRWQFPRVVSFIGATGAGKSTIIQNLVRSLSAESKFEVPVVGVPSASESSTSGGIHVYPDPGTFSKESPIVYAGRHSFDWQVLTL